VLPRNGKRKNVNGLTNSVVRENTLKKKLGAAIPPVKKRVDIVRNLRTTGAMDSILMPFSESLATPAKRTSARLTCERWRAIIPTKFPI